MSVRTEAPCEIKIPNLIPSGYAQVYENFTGGAAGNHEQNHAYVYGLDLISQTRNYQSNFNNFSQKIFYIYDGHGSVRALTDPNGNVTDTYDYDAFGNLIHSATTTCSSSGGAVITVALGATCPAGSSPAPTPNEFLFGASSSIATWGCITTGHAT